MSYDVDVVVAGGGPVGLMLACELRIHGVSVVVLERLAEADPTIKAGSLNTPSVEALYRRGLLPDLQQAQERNMEQFAAFMRQRLPKENPPRCHRGSPVTSRGSRSARTCSTRPIPSWPDTVPPIRSAWSASSSLRRSSPGVPPNWESRCAGVWR